MATSLSSKSVGSTVKLKVNGSYHDFIIVHQGLPSSIYDSSCNGTWLLMKDVYETRQWHSSNKNDYANSTIHSYLNGTLLNLFDSSIKAAIKQVKIPYRPGSGTSSNVSSGASGLSAKIFLLSGFEMGWTNGSYFPCDGAKLSYFDAGTGTAANNKRIGYLNSSATRWWLRSPYITAGSTYACFVHTNGYYSFENCSKTYSVRPALILPSSLSVSDDGTIVTNSAPSTPSSISLPSTIKSGSYFTVSWSSSSDSDGNLQGYYVYRSLDGGSWSQIYQGGSTSTSDYISYGSANSVQYRVYAYDTQGASSSYCYSSTKTIVHNLAPSTPSSITVPTFVKGGTSLTVTWGASSDSDGNLSGYQMDRQYNGGSWSQLYSGSGRSYTDTITKGWTSVAYRVRAYDTYSSYSSYTTSQTRTVNNNTVPAITCDLSGDLGNKDAAFSFDYSVADADGDSVTVTEAIDGVTKRTYAATLGASNTFTISADDFMCLLNGPHTIKIMATDANAGTSDLTLTFTKTVYACRITLAEPKAVSDAITKTVLTITRSIPADAEFTVMVTNNANDPEPVWEGVTANVKTSLNYIYENKTAENGPAYNFVITASRAEGGQGGYISSVGGAFE